MCKKMYNMPCHFLFSIFHCFVQVLPNVTRLLRASEHNNWNEQREFRIYSAHDHDSSFLQNKTDPSPHLCPQAWSHREEVGGRGSPLQGKLGLVEINGRGQVDGMLIRFCAPRNGMIGRACFVSSQPFNAGNHWHFADKSGLLCAMQGECCPF